MRCATCAMTADAMSTARYASCGAIGDVGKAFAEHAKSTTTTMDARTAPGGRMYWRTQVPTPGTPPQPITREAQSA